MGEDTTSYFYELAPLVRNTVIKRMLISHSLEVITPPRRYDESPPQSLVPEKLHRAGGDAHQAMPLVHGQQCYFYRRRAKYVALRLAPGVLHRATHLTQVALWHHEAK